MRAHTAGARFERYASVSDPSLVAAHIKMLATCSCDDTAFAADDDVPVGTSRVLLKACIAPLLAAFEVCRATACARHERHHEPEHEKPLGIIHNG